MFCTGRKVKLGRRVGELNAGRLEVTLVVGQSTDLPPVNSAFLKLNISPCQQQVGDHKLLSLSE